jgi:hypothetical protein
MLRWPGCAMAAGGREGSTAVAKFSERPSIFLRLAADCDAPRTPDHGRFRPPGVSAIRSLVGNGRRGGLPTYTYLPTTQRCTDRTTRFASTKPSSCGFFLGFGPDVGSTPGRSVRR